MFDIWTEIEKARTMTTDEYLSDLDSRIHAMMDAIASWELMEPEEEDDFTSSPSEDLKRMLGLYLDPEFVLYYCKDRRYLWPVEVVTVERTKSSNPYACGGRPGKVESGVKKRKIAMKEIEGPSNGEEIEGLWKAAMEKN